MSDDLISRQAILDMLEDINNHIIDGYGYRHDWCVEWVKGLPTINAVQVVRCKDCRHRYIKNDVWTCPFGLMSGPDGYCSWAERKEE